MLSQIDGVLTFPYPMLPDERGCVFKFHKAPFAVQDVYMTTVRKDAIKAWHGYQTKQIFYTVVRGMVKLALWDSRESSMSFGVFDTLYLGEESRFNVLIPPGVFAGFKGVSQADALVLVQASELYGQIYRKAYDELNYDWGIRHG